MALNIRHFNEVGGTGSINISDSSIDFSTTLGLVGKKAANYEVTFAENILWQLENFAGNIPPTNAIKGQLWYHDSLGKLKVYNGSTWNEFVDLTAVGSNITPDTTLSYDIGSNTHRFNGIYGASIDTKSISMSLTGAGAIDAISIVRDSANSTSLELFNTNGGLKLTNNTTGNCRIDRIDNSGAFLTTWINLSGDKVELNYGATKVLETSSTGMSIFGKATLAASLPAWASIGNLDLVTKEAVVAYVAANSVADGSISTVKVANNAITTGKLDTTVANNITRAITHYGVMRTFSVDTVLGSSATLTNHHMLFDFTEYGSTLADNTNKSQIVIPSGVTKIRVTCGIHISNTTSNDNFNTTVGIQGLTLGGTSYVLSDATRINNSTSNYHNFTTSVFSVTAGDIIKIYLSAFGISGGGRHVAKKGSHFSVEFIEHTL